MRKGVWIITSGAFVSMSFMGMSRTFLGTALPMIRSSFDLNLLQAGTLTALLQCGFTLTVFVGGPLSDVFKKSSMLMAGCLFLGINLILFGLSNWFWINLIGIGFIGIGGGLIESSSNPLLIQLYPGRESTIMNLHHFFFAAGSLTGPLIMGAALARSISWQWTYVYFGLLVLVIFFFFLFQKISSPKIGGGFDKQWIRILARERTFVILFFVTFFAGGVQTGVGFWIVTFLKETRGFSIGMASIALSLFFACIALGRLFSSYLTTKIQEVVYLFSLLCLFFVFLLISIFVQGKWAILSFALSGLATSGVFPSLLGMAGKLYPKSPGTAMGMIATAAGLGAIFIPWLMSLISQITHLQGGFLSFEFFVVASIFLMGVYSKKSSALRVRGSEIK